MYLHATILVALATGVSGVALPNPQGFIGVTACLGSVGKYVCYTANTIVLCTSIDGGPVAMYCGTGQTCTMVSGQPYCV